MLRRRHWMVLLLCGLSIVALVRTHLRTVETLQSDFCIPADLEPIRPVTVNRCSDIHEGLGWQKPQWLV